MNGNNNRVLVDQNALGSGSYRAGLITQDGNENIAVLVKVGFGEGSGHEGYISQNGYNNVAFLKQESQIRLLVTSNDKRGQLTILSDSGNRLSNTINKGSTVNYSMNAEQFPLTVIYDAEGKESQFVISSDCLPE